MDLVTASPVNLYTGNTVTAPAPAPAPVPASAPAPAPAPTPAPGPGPTPHLYAIAPLLEWIFRDSLQPPL